MKSRMLFIATIIFSLVSFTDTYAETSQADSKQITIEWVKKLRGDFSFKENWNYPGGVYQNEFGQLSCDGNCPERIDQMIDEKGSIYADSLEAFYHLVDTTHLFHSIQSEAWCYEWAGTDFIKVLRKNKDTVECVTATTIATHSSLHIRIIRNNYCLPTIELVSIRDQGKLTFNCTGGKIKIDRELWTKGIMKAEFSFRFDNSIEADKSVYWNGKIFARIEEK